MEDGSQLSQPKLDGWFVKVRERLYPYRPRFGDWHFWVIQGLIIAIVLLHILIELDFLLPDLQSSDFVPVTLFFVPVVYAALKFGFAGSVSTAVWATIVTVPNLVLLHHGLALLGETAQLLIVNAAAVFLGYWVDRERTARHRAKAYAAQVVDAQEKERQRIARDLHDDSIQTLVLLCRELDAAKNSSTMSPGAIEKLVEAKKTAEQAVIGLRNFARELRPPILDDLGIVAAIRKLLMDFMDRSGTEGQLSVMGKEHRLSPDLEIGMFRITQEALSNVEHHAGATNVAVTITFTDKEVSLDIRDNGKGFTVLTPEDNRVVTNKLGLRGMRERAELLGGRLEIQSSPEKGTRIKTLVPLAGNNAK